MIPISKDIITEWGLSGLSDQDQVHFVERIGKLTYQAILVRSLDILSEVEQEEFDLLLDEDTTTPEDVMAFLQKKIPTFNFLLKEEIRKLKEDVVV
jgi:hypothetical protein